MQEKNRRRLVTFLIVFFIVLGVGAIFSTYIYGNSAAGIGRLIGELVGAAILPALIAILGAPNDILASGCSCRCGGGRRDN